MPVFFCEEFQGKLIVVSHGYVVQLFVIVVLLDQRWLEMSPPPYHVIVWGILHHNLWQTHNHLQFVLNSWLVHVDDLVIAVGCQLIWSLCCQQLGAAWEGLIVGPVMFVVAVDILIDVTGLF